VLGKFVRTELALPHNLSKQEKKITTSKELKKQHMPIHNDAGTCLMESSLSRGRWHVALKRAVT